ncbi:pyruvate ferredoxin oxidoreductase, partial [Candidatus Woesearchaeota archaeon]|nr:pyruvate ferredoxin oxidoreductase [Candidatus Woesearchaeota archaeon]
MPCKSYKDDKGREMKKVIEASEAVAMGTLLCRPDVIPMYPITPQTHIVERLADYINDGLLDSEMIHVESEHAALSAAIGVSAAGSRTFTATASQGLALMHEVLFVTSGMRLPVVMAIANRALSAPINIWNDHQDSMSARDAGWIQMYVESAQEALDTIIMAYKVAEDHKVLTPAMVCLDGFTLSHVYEPVDIPKKKDVRSYLPEFRPFHVLDPKKPVTMGPIGYPDSYMDFKIQQQHGLMQAMKLIVKANKDFKQKFGRSYGNGLIEKYRLEDAEYAIMAAGTVCGTIRTVVDELRKNGIKTGMIKLKTFRPFPEDDIIKALSGLKAVGIIDRNISLGQE